MQPHQGITAWLHGREVLSLSLCETAKSYNDQGLPVDIDLLYKAFDNVPRQRLIAKLMPHVIGDNVAKYVNGRLTDREQRVTIKGKPSPWLPVKGGVPQGSVLGPTLFVVYINNPHDNICSHILKFADDTSMFAPVAMEEQISLL